MARKKQKTVQFEAAHDYNPDFLEALGELAELCAKEDDFRATSFRRAIVALEGQIITAVEDIKLFNLGGLQGVGHSTLEMYKEFIETGKIQRLEEMRPEEEEVAEDDALSDQVESLTRELGRAREQLKAATYVEGQAKTKLDKATSELRERNGECVRLRGKVSVLETQRKLDRDLAHPDGRVVGEAELVKRFGAESLVDPKGTYLAFHQIP